MLHTRVEIFKQNPNLSRQWQLPLKLIYKILQATEEIDAKGKKNMHVQYM